MESPPALMGENDSHTRWTSLRGAGQVHYDYEFVKGTPVPGREPSAPNWLRRALGDEYFREIRWVSFVYDDVSGKRLDNKHTESCDDVLAMLASQGGLRHLFMQGTQATDVVLFNLRGLTSLEDLYVWDSIGVSDVGVRNLKALVNLKNLHLDRTSVTDQGLQSLTGLKRMEHLVLDNHAFGDRGLSAVEGMRSLKWLSVGGNYLIPSSITDDGLKAVAGLKDLEMIDLNHANVTDRGLEHLAGLRKLRSLSLEDCSGITDEQSWP
jgi:hypothetical protein